MLKNKKAIYVLLPVVLAIWGTIGWKIFSALQQNDNTVVQNNLTPASKEKAAVPDTFSLLLNYRDPFLSKPAMYTEIKHNSNAEKTTAVKVNISSTTTATSASWPAVVYMGLIRKTGSDQPLAMVSVGGQTHLLRAGQRAGDVLVQKVWSDSVEVVWGKERKRVRK